jgi:protocatechuate 3,4-dioxygenase beta subunit
MLRNLPIPILVVVLLFAILWSAFTSPSQAQQELAADAVTVTATSQAIEEVEPTPTITPTSLPAELTVELVSDYPLTAFPPAAAFSLEFNQPVELTNDFLPVQIEPYPDSTLAWNRTHSQLRIQPLTSLQPGTTYTITVNPALRSVDGASLSQPAVWTLQVVTAPQLVERAPAETELTNRRPTIRLTFDRPMDSNTISLTVEPATNFTFTWLENNLLLQPTEALEANKSYNFTLNGQASDLAGMPIGRDITWSYRLPTSLDLIEWPAAGQPNPTIRLNFNYPVNPVGVNLKLEPAIGTHLLPQTEANVIEFALDEPLRGDTRYTAQLRGELVDSSGDPLALPGVMSHQTNSFITGFLPGDGREIHPANTIAVTFRQPMNEAETAAAFHITPEAAGHLIWRDNTLEFLPEDGLLAEETAYTVTLDPTARTADGSYILSTTKSWTFSTGPRIRRVTFGDGMHTQVLNPSGRRAVQFSFAPEQTSGEVQFDLYQLGLEQWLLDGGLDSGNWLAGWITEPGPRGETYVHIAETTLPADLAAGIYRLDLSFGGVVEDQLILVLSRHALVLKQDANQLISWLSTLDGSVTADAEIRFYDGQGNLLHSGRTDSNGLYTLSTAGYDLANLKVVALVGEEIAVSGLEYDWKSEYNYDDGIEYRFHIFADRPVYHAGETVYFRAVIRQDQDASLTLLPAGTPVTVRLLDNQRQTVQTLELSSSNFGTVHGEFHLPDDAQTGSFYLAVSANGHDSGIYLPLWPLAGSDDYQVSLSTDAPIYAEGQDVEVTVTVRDSAGQPVPNASVSLELYQAGNDAPCGSLHSELGWYPNGNGRSGQTDENGRYTVTVTAELGYAGHNAGPLGSDLWHSPRAVEAIVRIGGQEIKNITAYEVANAAEAIRLEIGSAIKAPGQSFPVHATVTGLLDQPIAGRRLSLTLFAYNANSSQYDLGVQSGSLTTGGDGQVMLPFTITNAGFYQLRLTGWDAAGREYQTSTMVYAYDPAYTGPYGAAHTFAVTTDRPSYAPGETARLAIHSNFSGPALLTFSRGAIYRSQVVHLTAPLTLVEAPIATADAPNLFVSVHAWEAQSQAFNTEDYFSYLSQQDGLLRRATTSIRVIDPAKLLNITITPHTAEPIPGTPLTVTVRVTNSQGEPVSAELSLALIDANAGLKNHSHTSAIVNAFYLTRPNEITTYHSMNPTRYLTWDGGFGGCGCGGDGGYFLEFSSPATAATHWLPTLVTDANGEATVTLTLPAATGWQVVAKAVTADTQLGETSLTLSQP